MTKKKIAPKPAPNAAPQTEEITAPESVRSLLESAQMDAARAVNAQAQTLLRQASPPWAKGEGGHAASVLLGIVSDKLRDLPKEESAPIPPPEDPYPTMDDHITAGSLGYHIIPTEDVANMGRSSKGLRRCRIPLSALVDAIESRMANARAQADLIDSTLSRAFSVRYRAGLTSRSHDANGAPIPEMGVQERLSAVLLELEDLTDWVASRSKILMDRL